MRFEYFLLVISVLLLVSILASKLSARLGIPALLLFLGVGMLAGSDGLGQISFDYPELVQSLGILALTLILFAGGLDTDWAAIRPVLGMGLTLSTVGVALTAGLVGALAVLVLKVSWLEGLLLGAIVSSTDAAAVFSILRARETRLHGQMEPLIEFESGSNDPMAVVLTVGLIQLLLSPAVSPASLLVFLVQQMTLGALLGYGCGRLMVLILNRIRLEYQGLYPALTLGLAVLTYGLTASLGGNGFLAVYLAGLVLGNHDFVHKRSLRNFHDGLAWLMQIVMFLTLGLQVFPSRLLPVAGPGLWLSAFLILVARPVSVFASLAVSRLKLREKLMVGWAGLRGAAPIILATFPYVAGLPQADLIFHVVFFIVLTSVVLQGTTISLVARWLGLESEPELPKSRLPDEAPHSIADHLECVPVPAHSLAAGRQIVDLNLPPEILIVLVGRGEAYLVPSGSTVIEPGDTLLVLADEAGLAALRQRVASDSASNGRPAPPRKL